MSLEDGGDEEGKTLYELLLGVTLLVVLLDGVGGHDVAQVGDEVGVKLLDLGVVLGVDCLGVDGCDLGQALQRVAAELRLRKKLVQQHVDEGSLEDVEEGDPEEEPQEALQGGLNRCCVLRVLHDKLAKLENQLELLGERLLELVDLARSELLEGKLKDLLAEKLEDLHVVAAQRLVCLSALHDLRHKILPVLRPLLLEDLDEDEV
mmetsp:Transcript_33911/g.66173  ORF Transcript_33911/g.66173 Transcript_33911/m.66173 type:complete len:206 (-) Transcript_33911:676-1293(-)